MTRFDVALKTLLQSAAQTQFLRYLNIRGELDQVSPEFPNAPQRRVDFVARVKEPGKRPYLAHIELQAARDPNIATRMLNYRVDKRAAIDAEEDGLGELIVAVTLAGGGKPH